MIGARWALVIAVALTLQSSLVAGIELFGSRGDLVVLVVIAAALAGGPDQGAFVGFGAGLALDLLVQTPFGLSALALSITGYAIGSFQGTVLRSAWWIPVLNAGAGSMLGIVLFAVGGEMVGQDDLIRGDLAGIIAVVALINMLLILPAVRAARWAMTDTRPRLSSR